MAGVGFRFHRAVTKPGVPRPSQDRGGKTKDETQYLGEIMQVACHVAIDSGLPERLAKLRCDGASGEPPAGRGAFTARQVHPIRKLRNFATRRCQSNMPRGQVGEGAPTGKGARHVPETSCEIRRQTVFEPIRSPGTARILCFRAGAIKQIPHRSPVRHGVMFSFAGGAGTWIGGPWSQLAVRVELWRTASASAFSIALSRAISAVAISDPRKGG